MEQVRRQQGKNRPVDTVLYEVQLSDNSYYVVEAVPDTQKKTLYIVTAFMGKPGYKKTGSNSAVQSGHTPRTEALQSINNAGPGATPETEPAVASREVTRSTDTNNPDATSEIAAADSSAIRVPQNGAEVNGHFVESSAQGMDAREPSAVGEQTGLADTRGIEKDMDENTRQAILVHKKLKVVEDVHSTSYAEDLRSIEALPAKAKSKVEKIIRPLAEKLGILNRGLKTPDVEIEFQFSRNKGLKESLSKQLRYGGSYADFARALTNLDSILKNAVLIEKHGDKYKGTAREDRRLESVSVLLGICRDGETIIPVQMEIKESSINGGQLYVTVAMTKIEAGVLGSAVGKSQGRSLIPASEYSLPEVFSKINPADGHFLKYVPDGFLSGVQKEAKQSALREDAVRIAQYRRVGTGGTYTSDVNGNDLYQQMVEQYIAQEGSEDYEQWLREVLAREG